MTCPPPLLLHIFPTFAVGGAQARFATLANALGQRFQHIVLSLDGHYDASARLLPTLNVTYPKVLGAKREPMRSIRTYRRLINEWRPDCLLTYNWGAIEFAFASILSSVRHIHVIDGFGSDEYFVRIRRRVLANRIALSRSRVIVPSKTLLSILIDEWNLSPSQVRYIPNGIDLTRFSDQRVGRDHIDPVVVGTVAALRPEKNVARLLFAFARLDAELPVRLIVVGGGACRDELVTLAGSLRLSDKVEFMGHRDDIHQQLGRFDIFALSSDTEQMPIGVLEAMASGIPIVATDVGDISHMISDENVPLIQGQTVEGLICAITKLVKDPTLREEIGLANRAKAQQCFDQADMIDKWDALLTEQILT